MSCSGIEENDFKCSNFFIENKKRNLCSECNFIRRKGVTRFEFQSEKQKSKNAEKTISEKEKEFCTKCSKNEITNRTHRLCNECNTERMDARRLELGIELKEKKKSKPKAFKATGELEFFREIWSEREHVSEIDGKPLGDILNPMFFSHVLTKGAYPSFRLDKRNIFLKTPEQHQTWEFGDRNELKKNRDWAKVFKRHDELKFEYYNGKQDLSL